MLEKIQKIEHLIKNEKIRNSIRSKILNGFTYLKNFITLSPGILSPGKVEDKICEIKSYTTVWVKNEQLNKDISNLLLEYESRYLEMIPDKVDEEKQELVKEIIGTTDIPTPAATLPNYVRKLLSEVDPIKGDVSYLPIGPCSHYCIVYKVLGDISYVIPLTTTPGVFTGYKISKSRFFKGIAIYTLYQFPTSMVKDKLTIPYDHKSELKEIFKSVENTIRSIFPREVKRGKRKTPKSL